MITLNEPKRKIKHPEDDLQISVARYIRVQYSKTFFCHVPNGGSRSATEGVRFKSMGVRAGMPDIMIFEQCHKGVFYRGLAIELKIKPNKVTPEQQDCLKQLESRQWKTAVCWNFEEAKSVIDEYLK